MPHTGSPASGPGAQHQPVVRVVPGHVALAALRRRLAVEDHRAEADAAELIAHLARGPTARPSTCRLRQVDAQELAGEAAGQREVVAALRLDLLRCGHGRWAHTATGVSPGAFDGRPRMVSGSSVLVVFDAMNAGLMSNGFWRRWSFQRPSGDAGLHQPLEHADVVGRPDVARGPEDDRAGQPVARARAACGRRGGRP